MAMLYAPGAKNEPPHSKYVRYWKDADLLGGDIRYIRQYAPHDLAGKVVITNTTTESDIALLRERRVRTVLTTTPRYDGRSFGVNAMEAMLTAYAGKGRPLTMPELDALIDELDLRPALRTLNE